MLSKQRQIRIWLRSTHAEGQGHRADLQGKLVMKIDPNVRLFVVTNADTEEVTFFPIENVMSFSIIDVPENLVQ